MTKHIALLKGGLSEEREVSLSTALAVGEALRSLGYKVSEVDVGRDLAIKLTELGPDCVFNALHGTYGEDGCIAGLLELLGIPYTHSGVRASAMAMHKPTAKRMFEMVGIPTAKEVVCRSEDVLNADPLPRPYVLKPIAEGSSVGIVIVNEGDDVARKLDIDSQLGGDEGDKQARRSVAHTGSMREPSARDSVVSLGNQEISPDISKDSGSMREPSARDSVVSLGNQEISPDISKDSGSMREPSARDSVVSWGNQEISPDIFKNALLMAEAYIAGRELTVGVLDGQSLGVIEISPKDGFYDYYNKYTSGQTEYLVPAPITPDQQARVESYAIKAHAVLGCRGVSRSDFRLADDGEIIILETNTHPGMTPTSLVPKMAKNIGMEFENLIESLVKRATLDIYSS